MSDTTAITILCVLTGLLGLATLSAGIAYIKTNGKAGGIVFIILLIMTWSVGAGVYDAAMNALTR